MGAGRRRKAIDSLEQNRPKMPAKVGEWVEHGDGYIVNKEPHWRIVVYAKEVKRQWGPKATKKVQFDAACQIIEDKMTEKVAKESGQA